MKLTPTESDLEARRAAVEAGRRIEAAREQGGNSAAQDMADAIRREQGLPAVAEVVTTAQGQNGEGLTARVTTTESAVIPADEGVEFVGLSMGGEPLPDLGVTETDTPARQPYEAPELTPLGTTAPEGAVFEQPTKVTGVEAGFAVREKDGPAQLTFTPEFVQDGMATALFALNRLGAFRAGERASEAGPIKPHEVRVLWFCGAFRPYSADWTGSDAFHRAQVFADALRDAGLTDVALTNHPGADLGAGNGGEGVQTPEEGSEGITTPQALAGACGAISVGDRFRMEAADADSSIYVDWRGSEPGAVHMRAFFAEVPHALGFCRALMQRGDVKEAVACIPAGDDEDRRAAAQAFAAEPGMGQQVVDQLRAAIRHVERRRIAHRRRQAVVRFLKTALGTFVHGVLVGLGVLAAFAVVGYVIGLTR